MLLNRLIGFLVIATLILFLFFFFGPNSIQLTSKIVDQNDAPLEPLRNYVYRVGIFKDSSKAENLIAKFTSMVDHLLERKRLYNLKLSITK